MCNAYLIGEKPRIFSPNGDLVGYNFEFHAEIYPNRAAPILRNIAGEYIGVSSVWGFPPPPNINRPITNIRNLQSPFWQKYLNNIENRCLVPFDGFCEWTGDKGAKRKVWFELESSEQHYFAGIVKNIGNQSNYGFLTTEPNDLVAPIHSKSMPVILTKDDCEKWLGGNFQDVLDLARPFDANKMKIAN